MRTLYSVVNNQCYCLAQGLQALPDSNLHTDRALCALSAQEIFYYFQVCVSVEGFFCTALNAIFRIRAHEDMRDVNVFSNKLVR